MYSPIHGLVCLLLGLSKNWSVDFNETARMGNGLWKNPLHSFIALDQRSYFILRGTVWPWQKHVLNWCKFVVCLFISERISLTSADLDEVEVSLSLSLPPSRSAFWLRCLYLFCLPHITNTQYSLADYHSCPNWVFTVFRCVFVC